MTKRRQAAQETRRKLVDAARRIVREKGLAGTTIDEICASCGVAKGTFYVYFKKKEDVLNELNCHVAFQDLLATTMKRDGTFSDRLSFFMREFASLIETSSLKLCQEWVRNSAVPEFATNVAGMDKLKLDRALTLELFKDGVRRGELRADAPVESLSALVVDVLYGEMLCWVASDGEYGFLKRTKEFCQSFLKSILEPYII